MLLRSIYVKLTCDSLKEKHSVKTLHFTVQREWSFASLCTCCSFTENHFLKKCLKLLRTIHEKLNCVSLKEKKSVQTLQFTVRSEWSIASLWKCCLFRENYFLWKCMRLLRSIHENSHVFLWNKSSLFKHFNSLC